LEVEATESKDADAEMQTEEQQNKANQAVNKKSVKSNNKKSRK